MFAGNKCTAPAQEERKRFLDHLLSSVVFTKTTKGNGGAVPLVGFKVGSGSGRCGEFLCLRRCANQEKEPK